MNGIRRCHQVALGGCVFVNRAAAGPLQASASEAAAARHRRGLTRAHVLRVSSATAQVNTAALSRQASSVWVQKTDSTWEECQPQVQCGETIIPGVQTVLRVYLRDMYDNLLMQYVSSDLPLECFFRRASASAECRELTHSNGNTLLWLENTISGEYEVELKVSGGGVPGGGPLLFSYATVPPSVSASIEIRLPSTYSADVVRQGLATTLTVPESLVALQSPVYIYNRRHLTQLTTVNVSYSIIAEDMSQAEQVVAAGDAMTKRSFVDHLQSSSAFQDAGYSVLDQVVTDDGSSYNLPSASAPLSKLNHTNATDIHMPCSNQQLCPQAAAEAGSTLTYVVELFDEYSNRMTYNPVECHAVVYRRGADEYDTSKLSECFSNADGTYSLALQVSAAGDHYVKVYVGGLDYPSVVGAMDLGFLLSVTPTWPTSAIHSDFALASASTTVAGATYYVTVSGRDRFGNLRDNPTDSYSVTVRDIYGRAAPPSLPDPQYIPGGGGNYLTSGEIQLAGSYNIQAYLDGEELQGDGAGSSLASPLELSLVVQPAALSAQASTIHHLATREDTEEARLAEGLPSPMYTSVDVTQDVNQVVVIARDAYGNWRTDRGDSFMLRIYTRYALGSDRTLALSRMTAAVAGRSGAIQHEVGFTLGLDEAGEAQIELLTASLQPLEGTPYLGRLACPPGHLPRHVDGRTERGCVPCDPGLECLGDTMLRVTKQHWLAPAAAGCSTAECLHARLYKCRAHTACSHDNRTARTSTSLGSYARVATLALCAEGYKDGVVLCDACDADEEYWRTPFTENCVQCSDSISVRAIQGATVVFAILVTFAGFFGNTLWRVYTRRHTIFNDEMHFYYSLSSRLPPEEPVLVSHRCDSPGVSFILFSFVQDLGLYATMLHAPPYLEDVMTLFSLSNLDVFRFIPIECAGFSALHSALVFKVATTVLVTAGGILAWLWGQMPGRSTMKAAVQLVSPVMVILLLTVLYPGLAATGLSLFRCEEYYHTGGVDDTAQLLHADLQVDCGSSTSYAKYQELGMLILLFFTVGWPLALLLTLRHFSSLKLVVVLPSSTLFTDNEEQELVSAQDSFSGPGLRHLEDEKVECIDRLEASALAQLLSYSRGPLPSGPYPAINTKMFVKDLESIEQEDGQLAWFTYMPSEDEGWDQLLLWAIRSRGPEALRVHVAPVFPNSEGEDGALPLTFMDCHPLVQAIMGPFQNCFRRDLWYWPCVVLIRRLLQCSMIMGVQAAHSSLATEYILFVAVVFLALECYSYPYLDASENRLSITALITEYLIVFAVMCTEEYPEAVDATALGVLLLLVQSAVLVYGILVACGLGVQDVCRQVLHVLQCWVKVEPETVFTTTLQQSPQQQITDSWNESETLHLMAAMVSPAKTESSVDSKGKGPLLSTEWDESMEHHPGISLHAGQASSSEAPM
ncbi:hypothetical protein CYMTET_22500 [Cymbomonas tetramitiformis]|uniref:Uncharacterized protein n=1 Tax=Cymbomonas tetramitiformis TaxID=36881 RepID=A0AAE0L278_9CHLO|nr:hypothetical protein CYMTET_22500 [Cymbomonas tetramitiformis]